MDFNKWIRNECVFSRTAGMITVRTAIVDGRKSTYAFIEGIPVPYPYFISLFVQIYWHKIPNKEAYHRMHDELVELWNDVVDVSYYKQKYKKELGKMLEDEWLEIKGFTPMVVIKDHIVAHRERKVKENNDKAPNQIAQMVVCDFEKIYKRSYEAPTLVTG